jgi:hypothetical protein
MLSGASAIGFKGLNWTGAAAPAATGAIGSDYVASGGVGI